MTTRLLTPAAALCGGLQLAFLNPVIALLLAGVFHADAGEIGLVLALMNTTGFISTVVMPAWADRRGEYLPGMLVCAAMTLATAVILALTTSLVVAAIVLVVLAGPAGTWSTMFMAFQRHAGASKEDLIRTRAVFSFAWVAGPPLAAFAIDGIGDRSVLVLIALVALGNLACSAGLGRLHRPRTDPDAAADPDAAPAAPPGPPVAETPVSRGVLALVLTSTTALQCANAGAVSVLSLLVTSTLGFAATWAGIALAVCAVLEIPALLMIGRLTRRVPSLALMLAGTVCGILYYGAVGFSPSPLVLIALQIPNALCIATVSGVALTWFQEVIARPGLATGTYMNSRRVGAILTGPIIATGGAAGLGYTLPFLLFGALAVLALLGMLAARAMSRRSPALPAG